MNDLMAAFNFMRQSGIIGNMISGEYVHILVNYMSAFTQFSLASFLNSTSKYGFHLLVRGRDHTLSLLNEHIQTLYFPLACCQRHC